MYLLQPTPEDRRYLAKGGGQLGRRNSEEDGNSAITMTDILVKDLDIAIPTPWRTWGGNGENRFKANCNRSALISRFAETM